MQAHRRWVIEDGYPSLLAAPAFTTAKMWGPIVQTIKTAIVAIASRLGFTIEEPAQSHRKPRPQQPPPMPRPPFMSDDDPLVLNGTYQ